MITCNHDPVRLLKTGMSFDGNVSCHWIRTKGFGSRIFMKTTRDPLETILCHNLCVSYRETNRPQFNSFISSLFWAKTSCKQNNSQHDLWRLSQSTTKFLPFYNAQIEQNCICDAPMWSCSGVMFATWAFLWQFLALAVVWRRETRTSGFIMTRSDDCWNLSRRKAKRN